MQVKNVMSRNVLQVSSVAPLQDVLSQMVSHKHSCALVIDQQALVGIITERDLVRAFSRYLLQHNPPNPSLATIMTPDPVCVSQDADYEVALAISRNRRLRHLPVLDNHGNLMGVVTQENLLNQHARLVDKYARLSDKQEELKSSVKRLTSLSLEDPLLGIGNRRAMEIDLDHTYTESSRYRKTYSVALFDIDHFKRYNDTYGHEAGDKVLKRVAHAIEQSIRGGDRVYRYGGEEILVLMPETRIEKALKVSERVRRAVEAMQIPHESVSNGVLTISGGVADSAEDENIVNRADQCLYEAKSSGRNCVVSGET